jgi:hypothetical protein
MILIGSAKNVLVEPVFKAWIFGVLGVTYQSVTMPARVVARRGFSQIIRVGDGGKLFVQSGGSAGRRVPARRQDVLERARKKLRVRPLLGVSFVFVGEEFGFACEILGIFQVRHCFRVFLRLERGIRFAKLGRDRRQLARNVRLVHMLLQRADELIYLFKLLLVSLFLGRFGGLFFLYGSRFLR